MSLPSSPSLQVQNFLSVCDSLYNWGVPMYDELRNLANANESNPPLVQALMRFSFAHHASTMEFVDPPVGEQVHISRGFHVARNPLALALRDWLFFAFP